MQALIDYLVSFQPDFFDGLFTSLLSFFVILSVLQLVLSVIYRAIEEVFFGGRS